MTDYVFQHFTLQDDRAALAAFEKSLHQPALPGQSLAPPPFKLSLEWSRPVQVEETWAVKKGAETGDLLGIISLFRQTRKHGLVSGLFSPEADLEALKPGMLAALFSKAGELEVQELLAFADSEDVVTETFLRGAGFDLKNQAYLLEAPEGISISQPAFPEGYFLRTYSELQHLPTLAALLNRAYYVTSGYVASENLPITGDFLQEHFEKYPEYFPPESLFILLNTYGKAVAYIRAFHEDSVNSPGIVPEERENQLHLPLLQVALAHLKQTAPTKYRLFLNEGQQYLFDDYRSLGFSVKKTFDVYRMAVEETGS